MATMENKTPSKELSLEFIQTQLRIDLTKAWQLNEGEVCPLDEEHRAQIISHLQAQNSLSTTSPQKTSPLFTTFRAASDPLFITMHLERLFKHSQHTLTKTLKATLLNHCKTVEPSKILRLNLFDMPTPLLTLQQREQTHTPSSPYTLTVKQHTPPHPHIKTAWALPDSVALQHKAKEEGFTDAVWLNEQGFITETTVANIFFIQDNTLLTPALLMDNKPQCLAGTTRNAIIKNIAPSLYLSVIKHPITPEALTKMTGAFICNAGIGVQRIDAVDDHYFPWTEDTTSVFNHTQNKIKVLLNLP